MKLGLVTAILDQYDFEKMMDTLADLGFSCAEVACWPNAKAERRYAGVSHIDVERVLQDDAYCEYILSYSKKKAVEISSLAFYPNTMDGDLEKRQANVSHLMNVIRASAKLGVNMVTTFIGRDQNKTVEENLEILQEVWPPIIALAEEKGLPLIDLFSLMDVLDREEYWSDVYHFHAPAVDMQAKMIAVHVLGQLGLQDDNSGQTDL